MFYLYLNNMKQFKQKWYTLFEIFVTFIILGIIALALVPRLKDAQEYQNEILILKKEMPKSYEYTISNKTLNSFLGKHKASVLALYNLMCIKDLTTEEKNSDGIYSTKEKVSDEACYQRFRVFESCENMFNEEKDRNKLKDLLNLVENEQQANTIIEKCENYRQSNNDEKINKILDSL